MFSDRVTGICPVCKENIGERLIVGLGIKIPLICRCERDRLDKTQKEAERQKEEARRKGIRDRFKSSLSLMYQDATFDSFKARKGTEYALQKAKGYVGTWEKRKKDGLGILFSGNTGSGKTHLAVAIGHEISKMGFWVKFTEINALIRKIRDAPFGEAEEIISPYTRCDLLILDDFGAENDTEWTAGQIGAIINHRTENYKPIIATSNLTKADLAARKAQRVVDRILGACGLITISCPSYRRVDIRGGSS